MQLQKKEEDARRAREEAIAKQAEEDMRKMSCEICMDTLQIIDIAFMETCDHVFHKECLSEYLSNEI